MFNYFKLDKWTESHFGLSYITVQVLHWMGLEWWLAGMGAMSVWFLWELLDTRFKGKWIFDPRGGDWVDLLVDLMGVLCGIYIGQLL